MTPRLTQEQVEGWRMNNGAMSPNEFVALCDLALEALRVNPASATQDATEANARRYEWLANLWPLEITRLVHNYHSAGPTSSEIGAAIDAAIAAERANTTKGKERG